MDKRFWRILGSRKALTKMQAVAIVVIIVVTIIGGALWYYTLPTAVEYTLTITATVGGTTDPSLGSYIYPEGTVVSVTAINETGYVLDHWELDGVAVTPHPGDTASVTMDTDHTLHAVFGPTPTPTPFSMQVIPEHIEDSIPGQRCVFLVVVADEGLGSVSISATTFNASVTVDPQTITSEQVAEVTAIPNEASIGETLIVNVRGERGGLEQTETVTVRVVEGEDEKSYYARLYRDRFIPWLAANYPEFGITSETEWTGTIVYPSLYIYSYYLFFSDEWEMGVCWHVTIPPHDWAEIYIRKRFTEVQPSYAFRIDSFETEPQLEPHAIDPLDLHKLPLWR